MQDGHDGGDDGDNDEGHFYQHINIFPVIYATLIFMPFEF